MSQQVDAATVTSQEAEAATGMSQEVSERGTGGAIFAGTLLIIGSAIWMLEGLAGIVRETSYLERELLDQHDRQHLAGEPLLTQTGRRSVVEKVSVHGG